MEPKVMIFQLSEELEYTKAGDFTKTATLELTPPTRNEFKEASQLSQIVMRSMMDASKNVPQAEMEERVGKRQEKADDEMDANAIHGMLLISEKVDFIDVAKRFDALALKVCTMDGTERLTPTLLDKLSIEDYRRLICEYIANFILPSLNSQGEGQKPSQKKHGSK